MANKKILITGMSGLVGSAVRRQLEGGFDLSALNRRDIPGMPCHRASVAALEAILPAFQGDPYRRSPFGEHQRQLG